MALQDTIEQLNNLDLNNMDWSRIGVWPLAGRLIVWLLVMAAIVVGAYFFFVKDLHVELDREITSEESLKRDFENKAYQAAKLELYKELMEKMDKDFEFLVSQLPRKTKILVSWMISMKRGERAVWR